MGSEGPQKTMVLPPLSPDLLETLRQEDAASRHLRERIGVSRALEESVVVDRHTAPASQWIALPGGWRIWSVEIVSPGALGVRLHLESLTLPKGTRLVAYNPGESGRARTPIAAEDVAGKQDIWTGSVFAECVVVECEAPPGADLSAVAFTLTELSHQYRAVALTARPRAESCENDATCSYPGQLSWAEQEAAVAVIDFITSEGEALCSGCLLNHLNTNTSAEYFLTANHCIGNQKEASTIEYFWLYQTSTCDDTNTTPDFNTMPFTTGGTLLATSPASTGNDFSFLQLLQSQPTPSGVFYAGWTTALPSTNETVTGIHHPGLPPGDYTRISFGNQVGTGNLNALSNGENSSGPNNAWEVQWYSGITEDGSSGSPLFDTNQFVIGQLYGGTSDCTNETGIDVYGRFDVTYDTVRKWLDPLASGTFSGLFYDTNGVSVENSGAITLIIAPQGSYTGKLLMGNSHYTFSGRFDEQDSSSATIYGAGALPITVTMSFTNGSSQLAGTVSNSTWVAEMTASPAVFSSRTNPAPFAPKYTLALPGSTNPATGPQGNGYATISTKTSGQMTLSGSLADGTTFSQSGPILDGGQWPLYVPLYHGEGVVLGWLTFGTNPPPAGVGGTLIWIKPAMSTAKVYPAGFTNSFLSAVGSSYINAQPVITLTNGIVSFTGGGLGSPFTNTVTLTANNHALNGSGNKLTLSFVPATGLFNGTVTAPGGTLSIPFHGALLQNLNIGYGYFLEGSQSGSVFLGSE